MFNVYELNSPAGIIIWKKFWKRLLGLSSAVVCRDVAHGRTISSLWSDLPRFALLTVTYHRTQKPTDGVHTFTHTHLDVIFSPSIHVQSFVGEGLEHFRLHVRGLHLQSTREHRINTRTRTQHENTDSTREHDIRQIYTELTADWTMES